MFNFWTFVFRGRLRRLERAQQAAALLADGKLEEAEDRLEMAKSPGFGQDVAIYHFVKARLHMARAEWKEADVHLQTALGLGLTRPSVDLCVGLVKARLRQPEEALEALDRIGVEGSEDVQQQAAAVKEQLEALLSGEACEQVQREANQAAGRISLDMASDLSTALQTLAQALRNERLDADEAALVLGDLAVRHKGGAWLLGLEPTDHAVVVNGRTFAPREEVDRVLDGADAFGPDWLW